MILKKTSGKIISLQPASGDAANPPLGEPGFGAGNLKSMSVAMEAGECLVAYTPSVVKSTGASGEAWGLKGLARAIKESEGYKAQVTVAEIITALKDFTGKDVLEGPLQILVIRKR